MNILLKIAKIIEAGQSLVELIKLGMITVICWQALSFGSMVIERIDNIESALVGVTAGVSGLADKTKDIANSVVSEEFTEKTDAVTDSVVDAKNNFINKFRRKSDEE